MQHNDKELTLAGCTDDEPLKLEFPATRPFDLHTQHVVFSISYLQGAQYIQCLRAQSKRSSTRAFIMRRVGGTRSCTECIANFHRLTRTPPSASRRSNSVDITFCPSCTAVPLYIDHAIPHSNSTILRPPHHLLR